MIFVMRTGLGQIGAAIAASVLLVMAALLCPAARAAEHVTLSNGFAVDCSRHETVDGQVRLYNSGNSYMDIAPDRIAKIETVADPVSVTPKDIPLRYNKDAVKEIPTTWAK